LAARSPAPSGWILHGWQVYNMANTRIYFVIRAQTTSAPTVNQWRNVLQDAAARTGTLAKAIMDYSDQPHRRISFGKFSQSTAQLRRYMLCGMEIDDGDQTAAATKINAEASTRAITGTLRAKFEGVLQAEIREAAVRQGFSGAQANTIGVTVITFGERATAKTEVQQYLASNAAIWYQPE
jgi:hypothetical protein